MATLRITQRRSVIGTRQAHRATLRTLGLKKIGQSVDREDSDPIRGMLRSVAHLISFEEVVEVPPAKKPVAKSARKTPEAAEKPTAKASATKTGKPAAKAASGIKKRTTKAKSSATKKTAAKAAARKPAKKPAVKAASSRGSRAKKAE
ncbi:MAG: 50S ribosomal protein L30 [Chloroflexi bacterium]|nr:50S ribosomal protein L30 [Chloroflexota bacterium]MCH8222521.1 50S ribosomal protein L30 [Chloroflexota bacterium]